MGNPVRIKETGGGTFLGLQEMTATEMDYAVHQILTEFSTNTDGEGTVSVGSSGTAMGTFNHFKKESDDMVSAAESRRQV